MGPTSPTVQAGLQTPPTLLTSVTQAPSLTLGSSNLSIGYAGLVPGSLSGLYQINAHASWNREPGRERAAGDQSGRRVHFAERSRS